MQLCQQRICQFFIFWESLPGASYKRFGGYHQDSASTSGHPQSEKTSSFERGETDVPKLTNRNFSIESNPQPVSGKREVSSRYARRATGQSNLCWDAFTRNPPPIWHLRGRDGYENFGGLCKKTAHREKTKKAVREEIPRTAFPFF